MFYNSDHCATSEVVKATEQSISRQGQSVLQFQKVLNKLLSAYQLLADSVLVSGNLVVCTKSSEVMRLDIWYFHYL
jgi:hypothetical protein